jgi:hypothetical protein
MLMERWVIVITALLALATWGLFRLVVALKSS